MLIISLAIGLIFSIFHLFSSLVKFIRKKINKVRYNRFVKEMEMIFLLEKLCLMKMDAATAMSLISRYGQLMEHLRDEI